MDTILCKDKNDAKRYFDNIEMKHIKDWEFLETGEVRIYLNCELKDIAKVGENNESSKSKI